MADEQIDFTVDDFNWNHELNLPQRVVDVMSPDEVNNFKRVKALVKAGCATPEEITEYTRIVMSETW
jgi:hypothetical protein